MVLLFSLCRRLVYSSRVLLCCQGLLLLHLLHRLLELEINLLVLRAQLLELLLLRLLLLLSLLVVQQIPARR